MIRFPHHILAALTTNREPALVIIGLRLGGTIVITGLVEKQTFENNHNGFLPSFTGSLSAGCPGTPSLEREPPFSLFRLQRRCHAHAHDLSLHPG